MKARDRMRDVLELFGEAQDLRSLKRPFDFGELVVHRGRRRQAWRGTRRVRASTLRPSFVVDMHGQTVGAWTVVERVPPKLGDRRAHWRCRCVCGVERVLSRKQLQKNKGASCGCLARSRNNLRPGPARPGTLKAAVLAAVKETVTRPRAIRVQVWEAFPSASVSTIEQALWRLVLDGRVLQLGRRVGRAYVLSDALGARRAA